MVATLSNLGISAIAYELGYSAYADGLGADFCRFASDSPEYSNWMRGYTEAFEDAQKLADINAQMEADALLAQRNKPIKASSWTAALFVAAVVALGAAEWYALIQGRGIGRTLYMQQVELLQDGQRRGGVEVNNLQ